jgi:hypothetical protein
MALNINAQVFVPNLQIHFPPDLKTCADEQITICPQIYGSKGKLSYLWQDGSQSPCITLKPNSDQIIRLHVVDSAGDQEKAHTIVKVYEKPLASAGPDVDVLEGQAITLTASGGVKYIWSNGMEGSSIQIAPNNSSNFTVTVINENGCVDTDDIYVNIRKYATISQYVWEDKNANGISEEYENGMNDVLVNLYRDMDQNGFPDGQAIKFQLTQRNPDNGKSGYYHFDQLLPGSYILQFIRPIGFISSPLTIGGNEMLDNDINNFSGFSQIVKIEEGSTIENISAGYYRPATIETTAFEDLNGNGIQEYGEPGIDHIIVNLRDQDGNFVFDTNGIPVYSGFTNASGKCVIPNLIPGSYKLVYQLKDNYKYTLSNIEDSNSSQDMPNDSDVENGSDETMVFDIYSGETMKSVDVGLFRLASINSTAWEDLNGNGIWDNEETGIDDIVIYLYELDNPGVVIDSAITQMNVNGQSGSYGFEGLTPSDYYAYYITPNSYHVSPPNMGGNENIDSDIIGAYGNGTTESFSLISGQNMTTLGAGFYKSSSIGDKVWIDAQNGLRGVQDEKDLPATNIKVGLYDYISNALVSETFTDEKGGYQFDSLALGYYYVQFDIPEGYSFVTSGLGFDRQNDSDVVNFDSGTTGMIEIAPNTKLMHIDAGLKAPSNSTNDGAKIEIQAFPNPTTDFIQLENILENTVVRIYNEEGQLMLENKVNPGERFDTRDFKAGTYYIFAFNYQWRKSTRFIKTNTY